jgi:hypothetical protein
MPKDQNSARAGEIAVKNLNEALSLLRKANAILDKVQAGWSVPDAPERPPIIEVLRSVGAQSTHTASVTKQLLTTLGSNS